MLIYAACYAQRVTPSQIGRSQELIDIEIGMRKEIGQQDAAYFKEVVLPPGCAIAKDELERISCPYLSRRLSAEEVQALIDELALAQQKAAGIAVTPKASYAFDGDKLEVYFD